MVTLVCAACGKSHHLESIHDFSTCSCGAALTPVISELISDVENQIVEINTEINKRSSEGICGKFSVKYD
ncbi:MAG: hypothetical protein LIP15_14720 [Clostridium sp.]|nr:hypothetical protein [Clostridium sp.]